MAQAGSPVSPSEHTHFDWIPGVGRKSSKSARRVASPADEPAFIPYRGPLTERPELPSLLPAPSSRSPPTASARKRRATITSHSTMLSSPRSPVTSPVTASFPRVFPLAGGIGESPVSSKHQQSSSVSASARRDRSRGGSNASSVETIASSRRSRDGFLPSVSTVLGDRQPKSSSSSLGQGRTRSNSAASIPKPISEPVRAPSPSHTYQPTRPPPPRPDNAVQRERSLQHAHRLPFASSSPDLRNLSHSHRPNPEKKRSKQLVYEASTMCDTFVYPQPKLKPILITPPSSPPAPLPGSDRRPSEAASPPPRKDFLSRFPSARRSISSRAADRRPSLPNLVSPDEASDVRVLREGHEREQEKIAWAAAARKGSVSRATSTLGKGAAARKRSGSGNRGDLGLSTTTASTSRGAKSSFDFLSRPPAATDRSGRSSAPLESMVQSHGPRKASSQGDLREVHLADSADPQVSADSASPPRKVANAPLAAIFVPPPLSEGNPHPFLGRPLPTSASVVDIRPDGLWDATADPSSGSSGQSRVPTGPYEEEPSRYEIGQAISPDPPAETSSQSSNSTQRTHRRYASQASRSISSLDAFHARFPPSPSSAAGPSLGPDGQRRTHGRANTSSPIGAAGVLPGLASAPALLDANRSWIRESQEGGPRKVASSSSMRVQPSTSGNVLSRTEWTFPPSPANTSSPDNSPNLMQQQQQQARLAAARSSRPLVQQNSSGSVGTQYATRPANSPALFHYENYEGLFFEAPNTPVRIHAPPPSSDGGDDDDDQHDDDQPVGHWFSSQDDSSSSRPPIIRTVSRSVSVTSPTHHTQPQNRQDSRYSVQSIAGEMGDLSAADFPRPPPPSNGDGGGGLETGTSDVASFFTAASRMNSST